MAKEDAVPGRLRNPPRLALRRIGLGGAASHLGGLALCGSVPRLGEHMHSLTTSARGSYRSIPHCAEKSNVLYLTSEYRHVGGSMSKHKRKHQAVPPALQTWIQARSRHHLSHAHVQMARELGMNPKRMGSIDNHDQEPWKAPLPQFIEDLYLKRFGRERPEVVVTIEQRARELEEKKRQKREQKQAAREAAASASPRTS
jgi:hypothetical protein